MNQLEKWNKKYGKERADEEALLKAFHDREKWRLEGETALRGQGGIEEAAAVFSYNGLHLLVDMFNDKFVSYTQQFEAKFEQMLEQKIEQVFTGLSVGMKQYFDTMAKMEYEKQKQQDEPDNWEKIAADFQALSAEEKEKIEEVVARHETKTGIQLNATTAEDTRVEVKLPQNKIESIVIEKDFKIPRMKTNQKRIDWINSDLETKKKIILQLMWIAKQEGHKFANQKDFRTINSDCSGAAQKCIPVFGSWKSAVENFRVAQFE